jgi:hypothetical protein
LTLTRSCACLLFRAAVFAQARCGGKVVLPLAIMTSDDTHAATEALLAAHDRFGLTAPGQLTLIKQEKVPALADNAARLALEPDDAYALQAKPHGHGDVHALLHTSGLARGTAAGSGVARAPAASKPAKYALALDMLCNWGNHVQGKHVQRHSMSPCCICITCGTCVQCNM